jgi:hypothetical protein
MRNCTVTYSRCQAEFSALLTILAYGRNDCQFARISDQKLANGAQTPYSFLACGEQEDLLPANRQFAALLSQPHFGYEFRTTHGDATGPDGMRGYPVVLKTCWNLSAPRVDS